jgi:2-polyprenyl-3-methyl-5-hydroxy-6-metoxy-1,4-benzoquinol methylase
LCKGQGKVRYAKLRDRLFGAPGEYNLRQCESAACAILWLDPRPTPASIGKAYLDYYTHVSAADGDFAGLPLHKKLRRVWDDVCWRSHLDVSFGYHLLPSKYQPLKYLAAAAMLVRPSFREEWGLMARWLPAQRRGRLLDVGCGGGDALVMLRLFGWDVEGTDVDEASVSLARSRGLTVHHGDLSTLTLGHQKYDVVTMSHSIEHVFDPLGFLRSAFALLKPGGTLVVITPNVNGLLHERHGSNWMNLDPPRHLILFTDSALNRLAREAGFTQTVVKTNVRSFSLIDYSSEQIAKHGRYVWGEMPRDSIENAKLAVRERLAALAVGAGVKQGDELVLIAQA